MRDLKRDGDGEDSNQPLALRCSVSRSCGHVGPTAHGSVVEERGGRSGLEGCCLWQAQTTAKRMEIP